MDRAGWGGRSGVGWAGGVASDATAAGAVVNCTVRTAGGEATALSLLYATTVMVLVPGVSTNGFVSIHFPGSEATAARGLRPRPVSALPWASLNVQSTFPMPPP